MNPLLRQFFISNHYNLCFNKHVCHVCKGLENLRKCAQCKTMVYCSKNHQKTDWPSHKEFCKAMSKACDKFKYFKTDNIDDYLEMRKTRREFLEMLLGRNLQDPEITMYLTKSYCEVCYSEIVQVDCSQCKNVFFCSEDHRNIFKEPHAKYCNALRLCWEIEISDEVDETDKISILDIPSQIQKMPLDILTFIKLCDKSSENLDLDLPKNLLKLIWLSPVASILYGLEKCGFLKNRSIHKNELTVHIVGGKRDYEMMFFLWKEMFELIFHWINNLTKLEFFVIGPELDYDGTKGEFTKEMCKKCQMKNVTSSCNFLTGFYHDKVKDLGKPDVIVCFNSGINIQNDLPSYDWLNSIEYLIGTNGVPLILTAFFLDELNCDMSDVIKYSKHKVDVLVEPHLNPFHCSRPVKSVDNNIIPVYYRNGFICVLQKKLTS